MYKALKPYSLLIVTIALLSTAANGLSLYFPKKIGEYIDAHTAGNTDLQGFLLSLGGIAVTILVLSVIQFFVAVYASEKIALDLRHTLIASLKNRSFTYMREVSGGRLITVMTSDVDAVKNLVSSGISALLMAGVTLIGAIIFLFLIDWKMAFLTLSVMPFILVVFAVVFKKLGPLFEGGQMNLDTINKVINESIIASPLVRVVNAKDAEIEKFDVVNKRSTEIAMQVVTFFAALIPVITVLAEGALLLVLWFGGRKVMGGELTLGEMSAFFSYTSVFIWPFFVLSFSSTFISKAQVSIGRINEVLEGEKKTEFENTPDISEIPQDHPRGHIVFKNVGLKYGEKTILKNISFEIKPHTETAILGPTGAGKTELLYLMVGLSTPTEGEIFVDGKLISEWSQEALFAKMGIVFQDSIIFNTTFKENILFKEGADAAHLPGALTAAELDGLVKELPEGLDTNISERGINLSGGQKQRLMLARALAINPSVLFLDDFTSRVDAGTEVRILSNIQKQYSSLTLISITQKIEPIKKYDHIIVLMEGELIAQGKHEALLQDSLEYRQIFESQQSTQS
jgi:ATP-binding cassette subfamily B protein